MEEEEGGHATCGLQSLLGLYWNTAKSSAILVSIAICLPQPQFCSPQNSLKSLAKTSAGSFTWAPWYDDQSCEDASLVSINLVGAYYWHGSDGDAAAPSGQHRTGFPQRLRHPWGSSRGNSSNARSCKTSKNLLEEMWQPVSGGRYMSSSKTEVALSCPMDCHSLYDF